MGSLVALSLTVEEKEEWVLSSNRKDNAAFAVSKQDMEVRLKLLRRRLRSLATVKASPSGLRRSFNRYLLGMVR